MEYEVPIFSKLKAKPKPTDEQQDLIPPLVELPPDLMVDDALKQQITLRRTQLKRLAFERAQINKQVKLLLGELADLRKIKRRRQERRYAKNRRERELEPR